MLHPLKRLKRDRNLTYREIAEAVRKVNKSNTPRDHTIIALAAGQFSPSRRMASKIHKAFPDEISLVELIYFPRKEAG